MHSGPVLREDYVGVDPFDALRSSRLPSALRRSRLVRQAAIQLRKRSPVDLSGLLGVGPFLMAKALGCFLAAEARECVGSGDDSRVAAIAKLLQQDPQIARAGDGWGYEFDVQTRWAFYPAYSANLIATVFVARGFAEAGLVTETATWTERAYDAATYLLNHHVGEGGWLTYTPDSSVLVHNANLLGAGLLAVLGDMFEDERMVDVAIQAARVSVDAQRGDGSWGYGQAKSLEWCDNFHTAYNLDGLAQVYAVTRDEPLCRALERGTEFWIDAFFDSEGAPGYFAFGGAPYDIHSAGTAVDVAARLGMYGLDTGRLASSVWEWTQANLIAPDGKTYYRKGASRLDRRHFVRWGDAHVALGRSALKTASIGKKTPIEHAIADTGGP